MFFRLIKSWKKSGQISILALDLFFSICSVKAFSAPKNAIKSTPYLVGISPTHKFVWFRVAKVGSTTVKGVFRKNHISMPFKSEEFKFKPSEYTDYFKFAFVRNPWSRVVSCYCQKVEEKNPNWAFYYGECFDKGFEYFVEFIRKKDLATADRHIRLQTQLIPIKKVDFIGRLENFDADFQHVLDVIGLKNVDIPKKNPSTHAHYSTYYNDRTRAIIGKLYKADIEAFGYEFEER